MRRLPECRRLWLPVGTISLILISVQALEPIKIPHEIFQEFIEPGLKQPPQKATASQEITSNIGNDLLNIKKMSWNLKDYLKETPLREGAMPSGLQAFGSESIFEIVTETGVLIQKLLDIVIKFEDDATDKDYEADPELDIKHAKALAALQKIKSVVPQITMFTIDTPIDFWKLTPIEPDSPDLVVWKALESLIIPLNIDIEDPIQRAMMWLGYTFEPNTSGTSGIWSINPGKADLRVKILKSIAKGIDESVTIWSNPWENFRDAIVDTAMEIYIPDEFKEDMVFVMGGKLLARVELYLDRVNKLGRYLGEYSEDAMLLIKALPEGWDRED
ncbi:hypothetical protein TWF788_005015 [Orbilia oligospora]|uniref:Uncharacterized protein n=1 Tax=Orbilia oligospora TaxID=2813651 RepID=A0A6G1MD15_ORBOL|nr:hypothetical protein TWF788_005015 [Orbilia oligospora]KAF3254509.1 hypothetical protein TWF192_003272 [Orbilia oligospora]